MCIRDRIAITGQDFGKNMAAWSQWLESEGEGLEPVPWTGLTDPVAAWEDEILTEARVGPSKERK